jgi:hypothetical protein
MAMRSKPLGAGANKLFRIWNQDGKTSVMVMDHKPGDTRLFN